MGVNVCIAAEKKKNIIRNHKGISTVAKKISVRRHGGTVACGFMCSSVRVQSTESLLLFHFISHSTFHRVSSTSV